METTQALNKSTIAFGLSYGITSLLNAFLVIIKENNNMVLSWMKMATGHHWITHSIIIMVIFLFLGWLFGRINQGVGMIISANFLIFWVVACTVVSGLIIACYYFLF